MIAVTTYEYYECMQNIKTTEKSLQSKGWGLTTSYISGGNRKFSRKLNFHSSRWVRDFLAFGLGTTVTNTSTLNGDLLYVAGNCSSLKFNWPWPFGAKAREEVFSSGCVKTSFGRWLSANGGVFTVFDCVAESDSFPSNWLPEQTKNQELDFAIIFFWNFIFVFKFLDCCRAQ